MAKAIVTQSDATCKSSFADPKTNVWFYSYDLDMSSPSISRPMQQMLVTRILSGSNEFAFSVLNSISTMHGIPGFGAACVPSSEVGHYLNIRTPTVTKWFNKLGFSKEIFGPEEIQTASNCRTQPCMSPLSLTCIHDECGRFKFPYQNPDSDGYTCVWMANGGWTRLHSPRVVLAFLILARGLDALKNSDGRLAEVALAVKRSKYCMKNFEEMVSITPDGRISMTVDTLMRMVDAITEKTATTVIDKLGLSEEEICAGLRPQPKWWAEAILSLEAGDLSTREAALLCEMSLEEFRAYYSGEKQFRPSSSGR